MACDGMNMCLYVVGRRYCVAMHFFLLDTGKVRTHAELKGLWNCGAAVCYCPYVHVSIYECLVSA